MKKIRITEKQVAIILKREKDLAKKKVLKINESQYKRLFRNEGIFGGNSDKNTEEPKNKEIDPLEFAQQLIIFVRDIIKRKPRPFSNYWEELGITRAQLIKMLKDNEVLELVMDEGRGKNIIKARKTGFRRGIKSIYKDIVASRDTIGVDEVKTPDSGYMSGVSDPRDEPMWDDPIEIPKDKRRFKMIDYFDDANQLALFNDANKQLYAISIEDMEDRDVELNPYSDSDLELGYPVDADAIFRYVNHQYMKAPLESITSDVNELWSGSLVRVNQEIKEALLEAYNDEELYGVLNSAIIPEMAIAGASADGGSSGPYVGSSMFEPNRKDTGYSPGESMRGISDVKPEMILDGDMNENIDVDGVVPFYSDRNGEEPFIIDDIKWEYCNVNNNGRIELGVYRYGQDIAYSYDWFNKNILKNDVYEEIDETTSMGGSSGINVGNGGDSIEHDVNAFGSSNFMKAGNKLNKRMENSGKEMPMVKRGVNESFHKPDGTPIPVGKDHMPIRQYKKGQMLKNGDGRATILNANPNGLLDVRFRDGAGTRDVTNLDPEKLAGWNFLIEGKKIVKVTESQMKKIIEATNKDSTAYPKGSFVDLDDCTKLNNNTEAQDGGCSQGAVDNVVKLRKTRDSVVSKG